jgi:hypothetical protein
MRESRSLACAVLAIAIVLPSCGSTGGGLNAAGHRPPAPTGVSASAEAGAVTLRWDAAPGADSYVVRWSLAPGAAASGEAAPALASPWRHTGLLGGRAVYYAVQARNAAGDSEASAEVTATPSAAPLTYAPAWAAVVPLRTLAHRYDGARSEADNGLALKAAIERLQPGDRLEIDAGRYTIAPRFSIDLQGTAQAPIRIAAAAGASVVITRPDANQNVINMGSGTAARYVSLEDLEVTGGSQAIKLYACAQVWIDRCHIHHCGDAAIAANSADTEALWLTRNDIHDTTAPARACISAPTMAST